MIASRSALSCAGRFCEQSSTAMILDVAFGSIHLCETTL